MDIKKKKKRLHLYRKLDTFILFFFTTSIDEKVLGSGN